MAGSSNSVMRRKVWVLLDPSEGDTILEKVVDIGIVFVIVSNVVVMILSSVPELRSWQPLFEGYEQFCLAVFVVEYALRLWSCKSCEAYAGPWGRLRYAVTPLALIDLIAISPVLGIFGANLTVVRLLRLARVLRLLKVARYSESLHLITEAFRKCKGVFVLSAVMAVILLTVLATVVYDVEREAQPEAFRDVPSSLWWATITLTTVGYGDIYPKTMMGRAITGVALFLGLGLVALPGATFAGAVANTLSEAKKNCPHCGKALE